MCGIAGAWGSTDGKILSRMMALLGHRGPDAEGVYVSPYRAGMLGHRRLSIMDPEGGHQQITPLPHPFQHVVVDAGI